MSAWGSSVDGQKDMLLLNFRSLVLLEWFALLLCFGCGRAAVRVSKLALCCCTNLRRTLNIYIKIGNGGVHTNLTIIVKKQSLCKNSLC